MAQEENLVNQGLLDVPGEKMHNPRSTDAECRECEEWNVEPRLVPDDPACKRVGAPLCLCDRVREKREVDVRIDLVTIGGCVMSIVDS